MDKKVFEKDLADARAMAAKVAIENPEDWGTCNLDSVSICLPRFRKSAAEKLGLWTAPWLGAGWFTIRIPAENWGMANRRTRAVETARDVLRSRGYAAYVRYVID